MSTNKSPTRDRFLSPQGMQKQITNKAGKPLPGSSFPGGGTLVSWRRDTQTSQQHYVMKTLFTLLVILCIYCLGSFPLAPHFLTSRSSYNAPSPPSSAQVPVGGGKCNAIPSDLHYLPPVPGAVQNGALPQLWLQAGYDTQDLAYASACAASFLIAYQSFAFDQAQTFVTCISVLSTGARQRFYGQSAQRPADIHVDQLWRADIQKQQVYQSAQTSVPVLLKAQFDHERMLAWMQVSYQLTIHRYDELFSYSDEMTVLVVSFPRSTPHQESTWQVSDWRSGSVLFDPAMPL